MIRKPVKKSAAKKSSSTRPAGKKSASKAPAKKAPAKKKVLTDREREIREANAIANSEKKKKVTKRPKKKSSASETSSLLQAIIEGMQERKAHNIMVLDLQNIQNRVTDYFVICDADSNTHVNSIADSVMDYVAEHKGEKPYHSEGQTNGEWILVDYINIVAHVFLKEAREHYNIEGLWGDAEITLVND
jgi:ribosome-associated protein